MRSEEQIKEDRLRFEVAFKLMQSYAKFSCEEIDVLTLQLLNQSLNYHNITLNRCRDWCAVRVIVKNYQIHWQITYWHLLEYCENGSQYHLFPSHISVDIREIKNRKITDDILASHYFDLSTELFKKDHPTFPVVTNIEPKLSDVFKSEYECFVGIINEFLLKNQR